MNYSVSIEIDKPIDKVIELFDNPDNMKKWMDGLESFEHLSGTPGQPGAKSKLVFGSGNRKMEMIETVTVRNLPSEFTGTYEMKGANSTVKNKFRSLSPSRTEMTIEQNMRLQGFLKVMGLLMPGMFKKQTSKLLSSFKSFAEKN